MALKAVCYRSVRWGGLLLVLWGCLWFVRPLGAADNPPVADPPPVVAMPVVVRIDFVDPTRLAALTAALDIWEINHAEHSVVALITQGQWSWLRLLGYPVTVDQARTDALRRSQVRTAEQTTGIPGYACYRTVEETYASLAKIASDRPTLAQWIDIGDSYDKTIAGGPTGYDIYALVLTNRAITVEKGKLVIFAAVHAREYTTAELATRFAESLITNYGSDPEATWLLDYNEIHIIPQGNPDGRKWAEQGYSWRKNTNQPGACGFPYYGVDLNRNSSYLWNVCNSGCSSADPCSIVYRGVSPASEPEVQAIQNYLRKVFADQRGEGMSAAAPASTNGTFLSLHSYGNLVIYPWDWTGQDAPNMAQLRRLGRKLGYFNRYSVCNTANCLYAVDGSQTDFAYGELGVATYTVELGTDFFQSCNYFENTILQPNLKALYYAAKSARRPYQLAAGPDTLDVTLSAATVSVGNTITLQATADDTRYYSNGFGSEPAQTVAAIRYTVDTPSWLGGTPVALAASDGSFNSANERGQVEIDTSGWRLGRHTLFVESQDSAGSWGPPTALFVEITPGYGLALRQTPTTAVVAPGTQVRYTLTVTNTGALPDTFTLNTVHSNWSVTLNSSTGKLNSGHPSSIPVTVSVPAIAATGSADVLVISVTSQGDPQQQRIATFQTVVDDPMSDSFATQTPHILFLPLIHPTQ